MSTFIERQISVSVRLASLASGGGSTPPTFAGTNTNTAAFTGHRASIRVQNSGALNGVTAHVAIWGLRLDQMNQLATTGRVIGTIPRNVINVSAGDAISGMSTVFIGTILDAYADFNQAPAVPMEFECLAGGAEAVISVEPSSFTGKTDVVTILQRIANKMGWGFENSGVSAALSSPYLPGSAMDQVRAVRDAVRINVELINNVLCVWPLYGSRTSLGSTLVIAPPPIGQMIGYPTFTQQQGIMLRNVYDPRIQRGQQVTVQTLIPRAGGSWIVQKLDHALDAQVPRGLWESVITLFRPGVAQPIVQVPSGSL